MRIHPTRLIGSLKTFFKRILWIKKFPCKFFFILMVLWYYTWDVVHRTRYLNTGFLSPTIHSGTCILYTAYCTYIALCMHISFDIYLRREIFYIDCCFDRTQHSFSNLTTKNWFSWSQIDCMITVTFVIRRNQHLQAWWTLS